MSMSARAKRPPPRERSELAVRIAGSPGAQRVRATRSAGGSLPTRERILNCAVDLFAQQGYDATSVTQVIERAGLTKGGFYHHFASKDALLYEVYGDLITGQLERMDAILARRLPPAETLRALIFDLVESTAASAQRALVFWRELHRLGDENTAAYRAARRRYHDDVRKLIRTGQASGEFARVASADTITFTIFGVINELPLWYRPSGRKRPEQIAGELADFVLAGLEKH
jgi:AcrR family transcriptional regulator